jgi:hypothetical protein
MTLPSSLKLRRVQDWGGVVGASLDTDNLPDVHGIEGTVTFTPSVPVQLVSEQPRSRWLAIQPFRYGYDANGVLRDGQGNDGVDLITTDSPGLSRQDWTWVASFSLNDGITRAPFTFRLPAGPAVDLSDLAPVQQSAGMAVTRGLPGESAYQTAKRLDPAIGTEAEWVASLNAGGAAGGAGGFLAGSFPNPGVNTAALDDAVAAAVRNDDSDTAVALRAASVSAVREAIDAGDLEVGPAAPPFTADPDHPGFYLLTPGTTGLTPDAAHPGFYLIGA